jgi:tape measure domain-containing protein
MATIRSTLSLNDKMSAPLKAINNAMHSTLSAMRAVKGNNFDETFSKAEMAIKQADEELNKFNNDVDKNKNKINSSLGTLIKWAAVLKGIKTLVDLSDQTSQTTARLDLMNESFQAQNKSLNTTQEIQDAIYASAQKSRVSYQALSNTIASLGNQAGGAFASVQELIDFGDNINKLFTVSGMDTTAIESTMYNLTQSLSSGKLLGQDYRILKQNAPQMIQYLQQYYGVTRSKLDDMVSAGKVSAQDIKNAMIKASDDINERYKKMPVTFGQVWTKFKNTASKALQPVLKILSMVADGLEKVVDFLSSHMYILYILAAAIGALAIEYIVLNAAAIGAKIAQWALNSAMLACPATWVILIIVALVAALLYLWETNDNVAYWMLYAWDVLKVGMRVAVSGIKALWIGLVTIVGGVCAAVLQYVQNLVNKMIDAANIGVKVANAFGANKSEFEHKTFADDFTNKYTDYIKDLSSDLTDYWGKNVWDYSGQLNQSRDERTKNRAKLGSSIQNALTEAKGIVDTVDDVTGTDGSGSKAIKTTTNDDLLSDEDIQLLLDVATRDYKLNYQQVTPNITLTFGDVRETADVDSILDQVADRLEEIYDGNLEVE